MSVEGDEIFRILDTADVGIRLPPQQAKKGISLEFFRSQTVRFNWTKIFKGGSPPYNYPVGNFEYCKKFFERSWGFSSTPPTAIELAGLTQGPRLFSVDHDDARSTVFIAYGLGPDWLPKNNPLLPTGTPRLELTRCFAVDAKPGKTIDLQSFSTDAKYAAFWGDVLRFRVPYGGEAEAIPAWRTMTSVEILDLTADLILTRYRQLSSARTLASELSEAAGNLLAVPEGAGLDIDGVGNLFSQYLAMTDPEEEVNKRLRELQQAAKDRGYILAIADGTSVSPIGGGTPIILNAGEMLQRVRHTADIAIGYNPITVELLSLPKFLDEGLSQVALTYSQDVSTDTTDINLKVSGDEALMSEAESRLRSQRYRSFIFDITDNQYKTAQGELLEDLLAQCEKDDFFRRSCAVWIPLYKQSLAKQRRKSAYMIIRGPLPGVAPCRMPQLFVDEEAALELSWTGTKLGELAASIALAPGEERNITLEQTVSRSREDTFSDDQVLESDQSFSSEYATEVEREARNTVNFSTSTNWSASAEGSASFFDVFSASGSASGGQTWTKTAEDFYRSLAKTGSKSASNLSNKSRREVSTSGTTRIEEQRIEKTSMAITNINDGRSLSILLYRVANIYQQTPLVRDLRLISIPAVPMIEGILLRWAKIYGRSEVDKALEALELPELLFTRTMTNYKSLARYWDEWISSINALILTDYEAKAAATSPAAILQAFTRTKITGAPSNDENVVAGRVKELKEVLSKITKPKSSNLDTVEIATPALFADCVVGAMKGTEPYSEAMRVREIRDRDAQVALTMSGALLQTSQARRLGQGALNEVLEIKRGADLKSIELTMKIPPTLGTWALYVDGVLAGTSNVTSTISASLRIPFTFTAAQPWITTDNSNIGLVIHQTTNETAIFLV